MGLRNAGRELGAGFLSDVRVAARSLGRARGFTAVSVATLALALGGNAAIWGVARNVFTAPLPFRDGDSVVRLRDHTTAADGTRRPVNTSGRNFAAIRDRGVFDGVVAQSGRSATLLEGGEADRIQVIDVSAGWAEVLGVGAALGRTFTAEEEAAGEDARVVLLSDALWRGRLGGDRGIVGRSVVLDGVAHTVTGVLPEGFRFPYTADAWTPFHPDESDGRAHSLNVLARLPVGGTGTGAQAALDALAVDLAAAFPETNRGWGFVVEDARRNFVQEDDRIVVALAIAVGLVLLLAAVNVANLLVARLASRHREIGIRAALGAGAARRTRPLLIETVLLFTAGGTGGLLLLLWTRRWLDVLVPRVLREQLALGPVRVDAGLVLTTLGAAIGAALLFGGLAALHASRFDASVVLRGRGTPGARRRTLQRALVLAQLSLALVLLGGAATLLRHVQELRGSDPGFDVHGLYTVRTDLPPEMEPERRRAFVADVLADLRGSAAVSAAGITTVNPLCCGDWGAAVSIEHRPPPGDGSRIVVHHRFITPGLLDVMGIPITAGRDFDSGDDADGLPVVIVDRRMANRYWPGEDPIGRRVKAGAPDDPAPWRTVVGVAGTVQDAGDYVDTWYLPYAQTGDGPLGQLLHVMVRPEVDAAAALAAVRETFRGASQDLALYGERAMVDVRAETMADERMGLTILVLFAGFGLLLAAIGIYGLVSYFVNDRVREIGTRIALGAGRADVMRLVLRQTVAWIGIGAGVGMAGAFALDRVLGTVLPDLRPAGPLVPAAAAALLGAVALAAAVLPARRAARTHPMAALRE